MRKRMIQEKNINYVKEHIFYRYRRHFDRGKEIVPYNSGKLNRVIYKDAASLERVQS